MFALRKAGEHTRKLWRSDPMREPGHWSGDAARILNRWDRKKRVRKTWEERSKKILNAVSHCGCL